MKRISVKLFFGVAVFTFMLCGCTVPESQFSNEPRRDESDLDFELISVDAVSGGTVAEAFSRAKEFLAKGQAVRIVISEGEYRGWIGDILDFSQESELSKQTALIIEGAGVSKTILSGAYPKEVFQISRWKKTEEYPDIYWIEWPFCWQWDPGPWQNNKVVLRSHAARREQIYLNGKPLRLRSIEKCDWFFGKDGARGHFEFREMAGGLQNLQPGEFTVVCQAGADTALKGKAFIRLPAEVNWEDVQEIDVPEYTGRRYKNFILIKAKNNLTVRKLSVRHTNAGLSVAGFEVRDGSGIVIEDCEFSDNVNVGLSLKSIRNSIIRQIRADRNGMLGISLGECRNLIIEDSTTNGNNYRGVWEEFIHWHPAGLKMGNCHSILVDRHVASGNHAGGLWNDVFCTDIRYRRCLALGNRRLGIMLELAKAKQGGGYHVEDCAIGFNGAAGIFISNAVDCSIVGSLLADNGGRELIERAMPNAQIAFKGHDRPGIIMVKQMKGFLIRDNTLITGRKSGIVGSVYTRTTPQDFRRMIEETKLENNRITVADSAKFAKTGVDEWMPKNVFLEKFMSTTTSPGAANEVKTGQIPEKPDEWIQLFRNFCVGKGIPFPETEISKWIK